MIIQVLDCPHCQGTDIVQHGNTHQGKQRYRCRQCRERRGRTFLLDYRYAGQSPEIKEQIVELAMNASGVRDTERVLNISPTTVIKALKKPALEPVNHARLAILNPAQIKVERWREDELAKYRGLSSERDDMWSYVRRQSNPRG